MTSPPALTPVNVTVASGSAPGSVSRSAPGSVPRSGPAWPPGNGVHRHPSWLIPLAAALLIPLLVPLTFAPWRAEVFAPIKILMLDLLLGIGLTGAGVAAVLGGVRPARWVPAVDLAVAAFGVLNLLAYVHSVNRAASLSGLFPEYQGLTTVLGYLAAYALARLACIRSRQLAVLFSTLTVTTGVIGGYALVQRLGLDPLWGLSGRPFATVGQPNSMAAMLVVGLPATLSTLAGQRGVRRALCAVAVALGGLGLVLSLSRGGWLATGVAAGLGLLLVDGPARRRILPRAAAAATVLAVVLLLTPAGRSVAAHAALRGVAVTDLHAPSTAKHLALARVGAAISADHPWLGAGQDTFPELVEPYAARHLPADQAVLLGQRRCESPHNGLLSISVGAGVPALLAYLLVLLAAARRMLRLRRQGEPLAVPVLMIMAAYLAGSLFMTPEVASTATLWVVLGMAVSLGPSAHPGGSARSRSRAAT